MRRRARREEPVRKRATKDPEAQDHAEEVRVCVSVVVARAPGRISFNFHPAS